MEETDPLTVAVDALTKERLVPTTVIETWSGRWARVHVETHPPLLVMLEEGTGAMAGAGGGSSDPGVPIDADALEILGQINDLIRAWAGVLGVLYERDNLCRSVRRWYIAHMLDHRKGRVTDETHRDVTRMVQGWVRMIESKFDPDRKLEWTQPCPALVSYPHQDGEHVVSTRCGARRVMVNDVERFAIQINVTTAHAECVVCGTVWDGGSALVDLRNASIAYAKELEA